MTAALIFLAGICGAWARADFSAIMKDSSTTGWGIGIGFPMAVVFGVAAIWTGA